MGRHTVLKTVVFTSAVAGSFMAAPIVGKAAFGDHTLHKGMKHADVRELQSRLKKYGYFTYPEATGYYGKITEDAVKKFQRDMRIQVDGVVGKNTYRMLTEYSKKSITAKRVTSTKSSATLKKGMRGKEVEKLQIKLKELGFFKVGVTGYYGAVTEQSVKDFQRSKRLKVTGIADQSTLDRLYKKENKQDGASSAGKNKPLKIGMRGKDVEKLQTRLKELGFFKAGVTGYFGIVTEQSVKDFQKTRKLKVTGIADETTLHMLYKNIMPKPEKPKPKPKPTTTQTNVVLKEGMRGKEVEQLQFNLKTLGFFKVGVTGYFGTVTKRAVSDFQSCTGLPVTGQADSLTLKKIDEQLEKGTSTPKTNNPSFNPINVVADAIELLGKPYVWGGTTPKGFDCSGFVQYVYSKNSIQLPRTVSQMWQEGKKLSEPQVGDLVFFETYKPGASHVGIYIGKGQFVHCGDEKTGVTTALMSNSYWKQRYLGSKRYY